MTTPPLSPSTPEAELRAGALFVHNHSGGKDSVRSLAALLELVPPAQVAVLHAHLGHVEWPGALELAQDDARDAGVPFIITQAYDRDGNDKTLLGMVRQRYLKNQSQPPFPSAKVRFCTSDLKRGPGIRETRRHADQHGFSRIVTVMGMRADESPARSKLLPWKPAANDGAAGRRWHEWLNIFNLSTAQVIADNERLGLRVHHAYLGNRRLSCQFCVFGHQQDLQHAAQHHPELYQEYAQLEAETGYSMHMSRKTLPELTGIPVQPTPH